MNPENPLLTLGLDAGLHINMKTGQPELMPVNTPCSRVNVNVSHYALLTWVRDKPLEDIKVAELLRGYMDERWFLDNAWSVTVGDVTRCYIKLRA